jgi:hypothetical protein
MVKVTFTLDDATVARLRQVAARTNKAQSQVVRDAVRDYADRAGRLSEAERTRMLGVVDAMIRHKATRPQADVDRELREIRAARRQGGRRHRS